MHFSVNSNYDDIETNFLVKKLDTLIKKELTKLVNISKKFWYTKAIPIAAILGCSAKNSSYVK